MGSTHRRLNSASILLGGACLSIALFSGTHAETRNKATHPISSKKAELTFNRDIAPILFERCTSCHRPGEAAPFTLLNYRDAKKRGKLIAAVTTSRLMPPWKPGKGDCAFQGDLHLTDAQIAAIRRWAAEGMPEGSPSDLPSPPKFTAGWKLGKPDLVVKMSAPFPVPADGPDIYRNFVLPLHLSQDVWVRAIDFRPSARTVVHHSLFFFDATGSARKRDGEDGKPGISGAMGGLIGGGGGGGGRGSVLTLLNRLRGGGTTNAAAGFGSLGGWAVGAQPVLLPEGLAYYLPKGADLILSTHFHPSGKAENEQSVVGLYFAHKPPAKQFTGVQLPPIFGLFSGLDIPAGVKEYTLEDSFTLPVDVKAFGVGAHAHYLGKSMRLTATLPNGRMKTLLWIPDWDFNWQGQYLFKEFVSLPKGTQLHTTIRYDNSADNPRNPASPPKEVRWGEQSTDEMGSVMLRLVAANESDLPTLQQAYRAHIRSAFLQHPRLPRGR